MDRGNTVCPFHHYSNGRGIKISLAQLDGHPTGDQEVAGSTPAGLATFFHGD